MTEGRIDTKIANNAPNRHSCESRNPVSFFYLSIYQNSRGTKTTAFQASFKRSSNVAGSAATRINARLSGDKNPSRV